jgi:POT family proton-dependent oligopeptide transporter
MKTPPTDYLGHPPGLFICFFTEMWERFSFYGMKALLFLYLTKYHLFGDNPSYELLGAYGGLVYALPLLGGMVADRYLGQRKAVIAGAVFLCLGHLGMAVEGHAASMVNGVVVRDNAAINVFYLSLALIIVGVGFLKPNISTLVGKLYPEGDPRRESGFTVFYAGINVGALFASLICGYLGETYGWKYGFGAAGIGMVAGLMVFLWGGKYLTGHAESPNPALLAAKRYGFSLEQRLYLGAVLMVGVVWALFKFNGVLAHALGEGWSLVLVLMLVAAALFMAWFVWFIGVACTAVQRQQMLALLLIIGFCLVFFTLYEQTYGAWVAFTDRLLTKDLFEVFRPTPTNPSPTLPWSIAALVVSPIAMVIALKSHSKGALLAVGGLAIALLLRDVAVLPQTAGSLTFLGAFFLVAFAPFFAWLWPALGRYNPNTGIKSALGLAFAGLAFIPLWFAAQQASGGTLASVWYLVAAYALLEVGEMCLSPIGLAAVTELSVPQVTSLMMGAWFLGTAFSEVLAAQFGKLASLDIPAESTLNMAEAASKYADLFQLMLTCGLGAAAVALLFSPWLKRVCAK